MNIFKPKTIGIIWAIAYEPFGVGPFINQIQIKDTSIRSSSNIFE